MVGLPYELGGINPDKVEDSNANLRILSLGKTLIGSPV